MLEIIMGGLVGVSSGVMAGGIKGYCDVQGIQIEPEALKFGLMYGPTAVSSLGVGLPLGVICYMTNHGEISALLGGGAMGAAMGGTIAAVSTGIGYGLGYAAGKIMN